MSATGLGEESSNALRVALGDDLSLPSCDPGLCSLAQDYLRREIRNKTITVYRVERYATDLWWFVYSEAGKSYTATIDGIGPSEWSLISLVVGWPV